MITGKELNEIKWREISPLIDDMIYTYQKEQRNDYANYTKNCFAKLEEKLLSYNLPDDTFKSLNVRYRNEIQDRMLKIR